MMDIQIRKASAMDVPAIQELWKEQVDFHARNEPYFQRSDDGHIQFGKFIKECIESGNALVLVAVLEVEVVGYCVGRISERPPVFELREYGEITDLTVSETHRRKGIGRALFDRASEWFSKRGMDRIEASVATSNPAAVAFWERLGLNPYLQRMRIALKTESETEH